MPLSDCKPWGPGYESVYYGINNTEDIELYKVLKFRVNWAVNIEEDAAIQKLKNLLTNIWIAGHLSGNPYIP